MHICSIKSVSTAASLTEYFAFCTGSLLNGPKFSPKVLGKKTHLYLHLTNHNEYKMMKGANQNAKQNHHHQNFYLSFSLSYTPLLVGSLQHSDVSYKRFRLLQIILLFDSLEQHKQ